MVKTKTTKRKRIRKAMMSLALVLAMTFTMVSGVLADAVPATSMKAYAFNPDNFKANIKKISIGAPVTRSDGSRYLPVKVYFTSDENINNADLVQFLEGYVRAKLKDGRTAEGVNGLGMTLIPINEDDFDAAGSNAYKWKWSEGSNPGEGTLKYNIPFLADSDAQTVENNLATGQVETNGLKVGDQATFQIESVLNGVPAEMMLAKGNEATITIEDEGNYPKEYTFGGGDESSDKMVQVPSANAGLVYNGNEQRGVNEGTGFALNGQWATNAGSYMATAELDEGYKWSDGTTDDRQISWKIDKAELSGNATVTTDVANRSNTVKVFGQTLEQDEDYTVTYFNSNGESVGSTFPLYPGTYRVLVSAKPDSTNYSGSVTGDAFDVSYGILSGADQSYELYSGNNIAIRANGKVSDLVSVKLDGTELDGKNYTVEADDTLLKLDADYLDTLSLGKHTVTFVYADQEVSTTLTVEEDDDDDDDESVQTLPVVTTDTTDMTNVEIKAPKTGEEVPYSLCLAVLFFGMAAVALQMARCREQDRNR